MLEPAYGRKIKQMKYRLQWYKLTLRDTPLNWIPANNPILQSHIIHVHNERFSEEGQMRERGKEILNDLINDPHHDFFRE